MGQIGKKKNFENFGWTIKAKKIYTKILELK